MRRDNRRGKELHEQELQKFIEQMQKEGIKIIDLAGKSPDAIMIKDGKLVAVEVLPIRWSRSYQAYKHSWTYKQKQESYGMFDEVVILEYKLPII